MLNLKRGDTLLIEAALANNGQPVNITGWSIRSQIRRNNQLVDDLVVTVTDALMGKYTIASSGSTENWPVAQLRTDIEYTTDTGQIVSTETYYINCVEDVTR